MLRVLMAAVASMAMSCAMATPIVSVSQQAIDSEIRGLDSTDSFSVIDSLQSSNQALSFDNVAKAEVSKAVIGEVGYRSTGCSTGCSVGCSTGCSVGCSVGCSIGCR